MKRKKSSQAKNAAQLRNEDVENVETSANCSLCLSDDSPVYECQQFLFDDLENTFGFLIKALDKNQFKICVTCSYHISILARFVNKNICLSGTNPLCFMCKTYSVFDIRPNELKAQLKNTPFGTQIEDKGNYYACVVCLYQLMKYQNYKNMIDNYRNGTVTSNINTPARVHFSDGRKKLSPVSSGSQAVSSTKTKNCPTVLLQKLDLSKFKLTPFVMLNASDLGDFDVSSSTKTGRKRSRSDPIYTEVLPKKRRYQPSPSPEPSEHSDEDDVESVESDTWGSVKKSGKRVTINTLPSVMKTGTVANKTPMKSALKTPQKTPNNKAKLPVKIQIKLPNRATKSPKTTPENVKASEKSPKSNKTVKPDTPDKSSKPGRPVGRPARKTTPVAAKKLETTKLPESDADEENEDEIIPETRKGRKKRASKNSPMKTPAEKKQMVTVQLSDDEDEPKNGSDAETTAVQNVTVEDGDSAEEPSSEKINDLIDETEEDDQAEVIIPEDTDNMEQMTVDDSQPNSTGPTNNEENDKEKETSEITDKVIESNISVNPLGDIDELPVSAPNEDTVSEIADYITRSIAEEKSSKSDSVADTVSPTKATNNGNSNSDKENTVDLLRDDSNSSDFGVIKKLNNNERVQLDINMDKIFDELRTEATP